MGRRKGSKGENRGSKSSKNKIVGGFPDYPEDAIIAVKYLIKKGITRTNEIAKRLNLSPFTVRNIKQILMRREKAKRIIELLKGGE
ncbi:MAG: hypothetical protein DRJ18_02750 [Candidatus Methanomethylicota archaeon]|nr:MAG: hypothetical protein DRJ18_02750 [Candidatus Verstraetearchaeota archaeon]